MRLDDLEHNMPTLPFNGPVGRPQSVCTMPTPPRARAHAALEALSRRRTQHRAPRQAQLDAGRLDPPIGCRHSPTAPRRAPVCERHEPLPPLARQGAPHPSCTEAASPIPGGGGGAPATAPPPRRLSHFGLQIRGHEHIERRHDLGICRANHI